MLTVRSTWMWLAVLLAAMPTALGLGSNQGDGEGGNAGGAIVLLSTILSIVSIAAVMYYRTR